MIKQFVSGLLMVFISFLGLVHVAVSQTKAELDEEQRAARIEKVRKGVQKLGTGSDASIKVKLFEGKKKYRGYVQSVNEEEFTIVEKKTGNERTFKYEDVRHVSGKNLAFGTKVLIIVSVGVAATILLINLILASGDS